MARPDRVCYVLGVVLEEVVVGKKQVHGGDETQPLAGQLNLLAALIAISSVGASAACGWWLVKGGRG
jgi:hypothetical protein